MTDKYDLNCASTHRCVHAFKTVLHCVALRYITFRNIGRHYFTALSNNTRHQIALPCITLPRHPEPQRNCSLAPLRLARLALSLHLPALVAWPGDMLLWPGNFLHAFVILVSKPLTRSQCSARGTKIYAWWMILACEVNGLIQTGGPGCKKPWLTRREIGGTCASSHFILFLKVLRICCENQYWHPQINTCLQ